MNGRIIKQVELVSSHTREDVAIGDFKISSISCKRKLREICQDCMCQA